MKRVTWAILTVFLASTPPGASADDSEPRVIHFPKDQYLGRLFFWDAKENVFGYMSPRTSVEQDEDEIPAQGDQVVPKGKMAGLLYYLTPNPTKTLDLKPLDQLQAGDLNAVATPFVKVSAAEVARLKRHTGLQWVSLGPLSKVDDSCLGPLSEMVWLRALEVPETSVTDQGLSQLKGLTRLQRLVLYGTKISDDGLSNLMGMTDLHELELGNTKITDAGLRFLAPLTKLEVLRLERTKTNGAGLGHLARCASLKFLDLTQTGATDESLETIEPFHELRWLSLSYTKITDDSIPLLSSLKRLDTLHVDHTGITSAGAQRLRESLPKCNVRLGDELIQQ